MRTKRYKRGRGKKYASRVLLLVMLAGAAFSVTFGCLYLLDRFQGIEAAAASVQQVSIEEETVPQNMLEVEPEPEPTPVVTAPPAGMYVVLDAGHGGNDGGTYYGDVIEKNVNLDVTLYLQDVLEENGVKVLMTRSKDEYLSLEERAYIANQTEADLFVSVHCNYYEDDTAVHGIDCYYVPGSEDGEQCAEAMTAALKANGKLKIRGAKAEEFYVTENTTMTAVLIEIGFLSNPTERKNLTDEAYQQMLAEDMADGILTYLEESDAAKD